MNKYVVLMILASTLFLIKNESINACSDTDIKDFVIKNSTVESKLETSLSIKTFEESIFVREALKNDIFKSNTVSEEEIELIALVTMAEAEAEPEEGKRLVIDTILNRVGHDSAYWPDTITDVIYQPGQFSSMWNGRVDRCYVMDDIVQLVREELESRTNYDVLFFTADKYGKYGEPLFSVGNHYFCGEERIK